MCGPCNAEVPIAVDQLPTEDLIFDERQGCVHREAPKLPTGGQFKNVENHLWIEYYNQVVQRDFIGTREWQGMQAYFMENGYNRTVDSLRQHVIALLTNDYFLSKSF